MADTDLPIDIHCSKLLEWLISRNHCPRNWQSFIPDKPDIKDVESNDYYSLISLANKKNISLTSAGLFNLSSTDNLLSDQDKILKTEISPIIKLYQNKNVHLAETASILSRFVNYESNAIKKQIQSLEKEEIECEKKQIALKKTLESTNLEFRKTCLEYNVDLSDCDENNIEQNAKQQLLRGSYKINEYALNILNYLKQNEATLREMIKIYDNTIAPVGDATNFSTDSLLVKILNEETICFNLDEKIQTALMSNVDQFGEIEEDVDWSAYMEEDVEEPKFGIEEISQQESGKISVPDSSSSGKSWDMTNEAIYDEIEVDNGDFIEIKQSPSNSTLASSILKKSSTETKPQSNHQIFLSKFHRQLINSELAEIKCFYKTKCNVVKSSDTEILNLFDENDAGKFEQFQKIICDIEGKIINENFQILLRIVDSDIYLNKLCSDLKSKSLLTLKYKNQITQYQDSKKTATATKSRLLPKLKMLTKECKERKKFLEKEISSKYNNRPVNIMGHFNFV